MSRVYRAGPWVLTVAYRHMSERLTVESRYDRRLAVGPLPSRSGQQAAIRRRPRSDVPERTDYSRSKMVS